MRRNSIGLIWAGGLILAVLFYLVGPDRFLQRAIDALDRLNYTFHAFVLSLGVEAYDVVHALALAMLVVFIVLGLMASRRGLHTGWALIVLPVVFLILVWRPFAYGPAPIGRWIAALVLAFVGAVAATRRLTAPPSQSGPWAARRWPADGS